MSKIRQEWFLFIRTVKLATWFFPFFSWIQEATIFLRRQLVDHLWQITLHLAIFSVRLKWTFRLSFWMISQRELSDQTAGFCLSKTWILKQAYLHFNLNVVNTSGIRFCETNKLACFTNELFVDQCFPNSYGFGFKNTLANACRQILHLSWLKG